MLGFFLFFFFFFFVIKKSQRSAWVGASCVLLVLLRPNTHLGIYIFIRAGLAAVLHPCPSLLPILIVCVPTRQ